MKTKVSQKTDRQASRVNNTDVCSGPCKSLKKTAPDKLVQQKQVNSIESSTLLVIQQKKMDAMFGSSLQQEIIPEGELTRQKTIQEQPGLEQEELPVQGRFNNNSPVQMQLEDKEELPGQTQLAPVQKQQNNTGIPDKVKAKMERSFNTDFSNVKVHANSLKASAVGALAFTQGHNLHFAPGQFIAESSVGQKLLGHELAHVVQQREGRVKPTTEVAGLPVNDDSSLENEADARGARASR